MLLFKTCFCGLQDKNDDDEEEENENNIIENQEVVEIRHDRNMVSSEAVYASQSGEDVPTSSAHKSPSKNLTGNADLIPVKSNYILFLIIAVFTYAAVLFIKILGFDIILAAQSLIMHVYRTLEPFAPTIVMIEIFVAPFYFQIRGRSITRENNFYRSSSGLEFDTVSTSSISFSTRSSLQQSNNSIIPIKSNNELDCSKEEQCSIANVDLSGEWQVIVDEQFKKEYDEYLKQLGQNSFIRAVALRVIGLTTENTKQTRGGREIFFRSKNPKGVWERTLITSSSRSDDGDGDSSEDSYTVLTADGERVKAEAWWEKNGTMHRSLLSGGGAKYGGGDFESKRYLENDGKFLICESIFHPQDTTKSSTHVTWKFLRNGETI